MHARYKKRRNKNVYVKNEERKNEHEGKLFQCIQCGFLNKNKKSFVQFKAYYCRKQIPSYGTLVI